MGSVGMLFKKKVQLGVDAGFEVLLSGTVEFDASLDEVHTAANEITQFPVESGVDISDHVRRQPDHVVIHGFQSDHPIEAGGGLGVDRSLDTFQDLLDMINEAQLITVVTSLKQYENMVVESMVVPRNKNLGLAVDATITLREVLTVEVAAEEGGTTDKGTQNGVAA